MIPIWQELTFNTRKKVDFLEITGAVTKSLTESGVSDGMGSLFIPHTTAGLTINENADPDVVWDLEMALETMIPERLPFRHGEGNSPAHLKASMMGASLMVPVANGRLLLGTWQGIYLCEFDGPRKRRLYVRWRQ